MRKTFALLLFAIGAFLFFGCASVPPTTAKGQDFSDPLGIGNVPTPPVELAPNQKPEPINGENHSSKVALLAVGTNGRVTPSKGSGGVERSDFVGIMSASGGLLTVWARYPGNWVWGYTPFDSLSFGNLRVWQIITHSDGSVNFRNTDTDTCLSAYGNGVIHTGCNFNNPSQKWDLIPFDNKAFQIKNQATKTCLQTPVIRKTRYYSIYTVSCVGQNTYNLDQQWFIIAPTTRPTPIAMP